MDADLRASLFVAICAAGLSMIVGAFAGVLFLPLAFRAIVGGALFGAAFFGAAALIRNFLPGLLPERSGEGGDSIFSAGEDATGTRVDIVLPGGEEERGSGIAEAESAEADDIASVLSAGDEGDEDAEEVSLIDDQEPLGGASAAVPPPLFAGERASRPEGIDDLDVLPDLDGFTDTFAAAEFSSSGGAAPSSKAEERGPQKVPDGIDPATLAKAVRTILKRDQKG